MGIKANDSRDTLGSIRFFGLTALNNIVSSATIASSHRVGSARNIFMGEADIDPKSSIPAGARHPVAWQMPQKAGGLASHNSTRIDLTPAGFAVLGLPGSGTTTITFTSTATGGLIVSGSGTATVTFSPTGTLISVASGSGTAEITFSATGLIGALAGMSGQTTIACTPAALISAIGYLAGLSTNESEFSVDNLAIAVWEALAASHNTPGTMGELLNNAGAGGNPWSADTASNNTPGTFGALVQNIPDDILDQVDSVETGVTVREALRIVLSALAGKISGASTNTITIRNVGDTKDRIVATVDTYGNRTAVTLDDS